MAVRLTSHPGVEGIWGPVTSTLDWCEANHQFSYYIAEMANTFSNLVTITIALAGAGLAYREGLPFRLVIVYIIMAGVALGSFAFHATLLYEAQLADELPMVFGATFILFNLLDIRPGPLWSPRPMLTAVILFALDLLFTWSYIVCRNPSYHQTVFGSLLVVIIFRTRSLLRRNADKFPDSFRKQALAFMWTGTALFAVAFVIWTLDNTFCDALTQWRTFLGWPAAFLLEGHAWWHILTGIGSYLIAMGVASTLASKKIIGNLPGTSSLGYLTSNVFPKLRQIDANTQDAVDYGVVKSSGG